MMEKKGQKTKWEEGGDQERIGGKENGSLPFVCVGSIVTHDGKMQDECRVHEWTQNSVRERRALGPGAWRREVIDSCRLHRRRKQKGKEQGPGIQGVKDWV